MQQQAMWPGPVIRAMAAMGYGPLIRGLMVGGWLMVGYDMVGLGWLQLVALIIWLWLWWLSVMVEVVAQRLWAIRLLIFYGLMIKD